MELGSDEAFAGYWNRPDADAKAIRDGWYATGDTGHLDEDGDLWAPDGTLVAQSRQLGLLIGAEA